MVRQWMVVCGVAALATCLSARVYDVDEQVGRDGLAKVSQATATAVTQALVSEARAGDIVLLSRKYATGDITVDARNSGVSLNWGTGGKLVISGAVKDLRLNDIDMDLVGESGTGAFLQDAVITNLTGGIEKVRADGVLTVVHQIAGSPWAVTGQWTNCTTLWLRILAEFVAKSMVTFTNADATNSKIYGIIETDYGNTSPTIAMSNTSGLSMGGGDSERSGSQTGVYTFVGCSNMNFVATRTYWTHGTQAYTTNGWLFANSTNMNWVVSNDIGDNVAWSLKTVNCAGFKIWGGFFADSVSMDAATVNSPDHFRFCHIPLGFGSKPIHQWGGPADIMTDTVIAYKGLVIDRSTTLDGAPDFSGVEVPRPPRLGVIKHTGLQEFGSSLGKRRAPATTSAGWGAAAVAAGLDITGTKSSSAVVQKLLREEAFVELPAGDILFSESVRIPARIDIRRLVIAGAGPQFTTIRTTGNFPAFIDEDPVPVLARAGKTVRDLAETHFSGIAYDGGGTTDWGQRYGTHSSTQHTNEEYRNYLIGGVAIGDYSKVDDPVYMVKSDGNDQVRWVNCKFIDCGDYGIFCNREMTDKQLFHNCLFENLKKAGLSYTRTHMFEASTITNCTFRNIDGPGVKFGGNVLTSLGKGPGPFTMQNCLFEECGSATEAACELSNSESAAHINNRIVIKTKPWKYGMATSGQYIQKLTVDVDTTKMVAGGAALALRHAHQWGNNRVGASVISLAQSQGPVRFINDCAWFASYYGDNVAMPASFARYPWDYTHLFDSCSFEGGAKFFDYVLVNTAEDGTYENQIAFKGLTVALREPVQPPAMHPRGEGSQVERLFDLRGRLVATKRIGAGAPIASCPTSRGVVVRATADGKHRPSVSLR